MDNSLKTTSGYKSHILTGLILSVLLVLVYAQVRNHEFVAFDDDQYLVENPYIREGLTTDGLMWAFSFQDKDKYYWRPLAWVSHMLDFEIFGADAGWHHIVNSLLHLANTLLLYVLLFRMTGKVRHCAVVAALFALHPINVESVAWVTERSNVLCTTAGLLTLLGYLHYARLPSLHRYLIVLLLFLLCLLVKPILVTLPFLMLLLDLWPLARFNSKSLPSRFPVMPIRRLIGEKLPLIILACIVTGLSLQKLGTSAPIDPIPFGLRLSNALVVYVKYLVNIFYPFDLAAFYPFPKFIPLWKTIGALLILASISAFALLQIKKRPEIFVGWFWFTGTMFPTIGLVQAGLWPELADRWAYFPAIGFFIVAVWFGMACLERVSRRARIIVLLPLSAVGIVMVGLTWLQIGYWANSTVLFERMLAKTHGNWVAHNNLGQVLAKNERQAEARRHFLRAIAINPNFEMAYFNIGKIEREKGDTEKAIVWFEKAIAIQPSNYGAHIILGNAYFQTGNYTKSWHHYAEAIRLNADSSAIPFNGLGGILAKAGRYEEAVDMFEKALAIEPGYEPAKRNRARVLVAMRAHRSDAKKAPEHQSSGGNRN